MILAPLEVMHIVVFGEARHESAWRSLSLLLNTKIEAEAILAPSGVIDLGRQLVIGEDQVAQDGFA